MKKFIVGTLATLIIAIVTWGATEEWVYSRFPSTCPFSDYLPNSAQATQCDYNGTISFSVKFQATGTVADFEFFIKKLTQNLPNPVLQEKPSIRIDGQPVTSRLHRKITADHGIFVDLYWANGVIKMTYQEG